MSYFYCSPQRSHFQDGIFPKNPGKILCRLRMDVFPKKWYNKHIVRIIVPFYSHLPHPAPVCSGKSFLPSRKSEPASRLGLFQSIQKSIAATPAITPITGNRQPQQPLFRGGGPHIPPPMGGLGGGGRCPIGGRRCIPPPIGGLGPPKPGPPGPLCPPGPPGPP